MLVREYEEQGGGYRNKEKTSSQKSLKKWGDEKWQTKTGEKATHEDGTTSRYLPKKAWDSLPDSEKKKTEEKKLKGSKEGKQLVGNTSKAKSARKRVGEKR